MESTDFFFKALKFTDDLNRFSAFLFSSSLPLVLDKEIEDDWISERKQQKGGALGVSLSAKRGGRFRFY